MHLPEKLKELLKRAKGITSNSKEVEEDYIFFAIKGTKFDGHKFWKEALGRGALAVVCEKDLPAPKERLISVEDSRKALGESAHVFFRRPSEVVKVIGITGTNGKTTSTYVISSILQRAGYKPGVMGTIQYTLRDKVLGSGQTTPDPITWHRTLSQMKDMGATHVVAEISSHALDQDRVWATNFEAVVFTNLTQDHLDYHKDMESYYKAKAQLFLEYDYRFAVINTDDPYGKRLAKETKKDTITYGRSGELKIEDFETDFEGSRIEINYKGSKYTFHSNLIGNFQAYNLCAGIGYALKVGIEPKLIAQALKDIHVPGRFEVYRSKRGFLVIVDYAHTPDAMENVLKTIRKLSKNRVICVFGAGGDRDRTKRPLMGQAAQKWSDIIIVTSDNPRSEEPQDIILDILSGIKDKSRTIQEPDRRTAIETALSLAEPGDIVAILGKGHEDYQDVKGVKYPFSDSEVVKELI